MFKPQAPHDIDRLDRQMRVKLAASVEYLCNQSCMSDVLGDFDIATLRAEIEAHRQPPSVFGRYFRTVFAVRSGLHQEAADLLRDIADLARETPVFGVKPLNEAAMGADAVLYAHLLNAGEKRVFIAPPDLARWDGFDIRVATAIELLDASAPALAAETRALVCEVVGCMPADRRDAFGAISSLTLWGATVLSLDRHSETLDIMETLVHESAHMLLFGYASESPLVTNAAAERFSSPLRKDARPMDGVFHATFVCARLHLFYRTLAATEVPGLPLDGHMIEQRLEKLARKFEDGIDVIDRHARLTAKGEELVRDTRHGMAQAAA